MITRRMIKWFFSLALLLSLATLLPRSAGAQQPDVINQYSVHVTPQNDGTLSMQYNFSGYCATTDFPSDKPYLQVGVPNRNFDLVDWGPKSAPNGQTKVWVTSADPIQGVNSQVQLNFNKQPLAGECWDLNFTITQRRMAYAQGSNEVSFQFTPGWFDFAKINALTITWDLPADATLVHKTDPAPTSSPNQAVWTDTNLAPNDKFTVTIIYAKSAFPNLSALPANPPPGSPSSNGSPAGQDYTGLICLILLVVLVVYFLVRARSGYGGYGSGLGGAFLGGFGGGGSSDSGSSIGRSGGGGGGFAGRGSSCACASCACACACAGGGGGGGGRAGCSRKGFDISLLIKKKSSTVV